MSPEFKTPEGDKIRLHCVAWKVSPAPPFIPRPNCLSSSNTPIQNTFSCFYPVSLRVISGPFAIITLPAVLFQVVTQQRFAVWLTKGCELCFLVRRFFCPDSDLCFHLACCKALAKSPNLHKISASLKSEKLGHKSQGRLVRQDGAESEELMAFSAPK